MTEYSGQENISQPADLLYIQVYYVYTVGIMYYLSSLLDAGPLLT
jgi:hypothetical protein